MLAPTILCISLPHYRKGAGRRAERNFMNYDFDIFWKAFSVQPEYSNRHHACCDLWSSQTDSRRKAIIDDLYKHMAAGTKTQQRNPYFYIQDFAPPRTQTLTFKEYYARFGTTLEQDGWRMTNPTGQQVIYVKG